MWINKDEDEARIYEETKEDFDRKIKSLRKQVEEMDDTERNEIVELEVFIDILNNAKNYYKKASYVQKRKIAKILFSNIKINTKKELVIQIKPELQTLFNPIWWSQGDLNPCPERKNQLVYYHSLFWKYSEVAKKKDKILPEKYVLYMMAATYF